MPVTVTAALLLAALLSAFGQPTVTADATCDPAVQTCDGHSQGGP